MQLKTTDDVCDFIASHMSSLPPIRFRVLQDRLTIQNPAATEWVDLETIRFTLGRVRVSWKTEVQGKGKLTLYGYHGRGLYVPIYWENLTAGMKRRLKNIIQEMILEV